MRLLCKTERHSLIRVSFFICVKNVGSVKDEMSWVDLI